MEGTEVARLRRRFLFVIQQVPLFCTRHHLCRQEVVLASTRQLRSQGPLSVHANHTEGVTGSEGRKGANGIGGGDRSRGRERERRRERGRRQERGRERRWRRARGGNENGGRGELSNARGTGDEGVNGARTGTRTGTGTGVETRGRTEDGGTGTGTGTGMRAVTEMGTGQGWERTRE